MKNIELEIYVEQPIFELIINSPEKITSLPKEMYNKFKNYLIQEERFEDITKLENIKNKVINKTLEEMLNNK